VFGYHLTGSTGTLFLFGIAVGAVASLGLCLLVTGTRPVASREADARRAAACLHRETTSTPDEGTTSRHRCPS
jgi:hypothetical protein